MLDGMEDRIMGLIVVGSLALILGIVLTAVYASVGDWIMLAWSVPMIALGFWTIQRGGERVRKELLK